MLGIRGAALSETPRDGDILEDALNG